MSVLPENDLLCDVCRSLYDDPRKLRCGHSFCYQCILSQFDCRSNQIVCARCKRVEQFESFTHFETSLMIDGFVDCLMGEHQRKATILTTPSLTFTLEDILQRTPTPFLVAKCAECTLKKELVVCPECERVICFECIYQHQLIVNNKVEQLWEQCRKTWNEIYPKSILLDSFRTDLDEQILIFKSTVEQRAKSLIETIKKYREIYDEKLNQFSMNFSEIRNQIEVEYRKIDMFLKENGFSKNLNEINKRIKNFNEFLDEKSEELKKIFQRTYRFSTNEIETSLIGKLSFCTREELLEKKNNEEKNSKGNLVEPSKISNKKFLWSIHFKFVPQYIVLYRQSILFASDRWGFVSTWNYSNARTKPTPKKSFVLFPQFRVGSWSRVYVESFSVYDPYICVFVKGSDDSVSNFIAFFSHTGQLQTKVDYDHRYSLRQLICDETPKGNCIWAVDRAANSIYKYDLPRTNKEIKNFLSNHTSSTRLVSRSCDVIRMAANQNVLALLDARTQLVTLYDKTTQKEIGIFSREFLSVGDHKLWRVELFADDSLLLRFDDEERTGDRSQIIHHIVVHVKKINEKYKTISQIQATNAYGFAIGSESEVILGLRKTNCFEGLIACYI